jgi:alpha-tubulin suppressor-like RCC1 family protein
VVPNLFDVVHISAGHNHACAVRENGTVWCWGYNAYGQLGNGTATSTASL